MVYVDVDVRIGGMRGGSQMWTRGGRVKNRQIFAYVLYVEPLSGRILIVAGGLQI